jgi:hypothetical protein
VLFCVSALAFGQVATGGIRGNVTDTSDSVIPGAEVTVIQDATNFTRVEITDEGGRFTFVLLPVGTYTLETTLPGFKKYSQTQIPLSTNDVLSINPVLEVGEVTQTVEVIGQAPLIQTETSEVSTLIEEGQIKELPLFGRNVVQLAVLTPGTSFYQIPIVVTDDPNWGGNKFAASGNNLFGVQFSLDGTDYGDPRGNVAMDFPNPEAVQEFRFQTGNYGAQFGKSQGGRLEVVTKSGSNELHGSVWEFNRTERLAATPYFLNEKPPYSQNQWGFALGGPAIQDKLFWFTSMQWLKIREDDITSSALPPTAAERSGNFSNSIEGIPTDPLTGEAFPGGIIPADRFDPVALNLLDLAPLPNQANGRYIETRSKPTDHWQLTLRSDWDINEQNRLAVSLFTFSTDSFTPFPSLIHLPYSGDLTGYKPIIGPGQTTFATTHTYTFSPTTINHFRYGYQDLEWPLNRCDTINSVPVTFVTLGVKQPTSQLLLPDGEVFEEPCGPPSLSMSGRYSMEGGGVWSLWNEKHQFMESVTHTAGAHSFRFGFEYQHMTMTHVSTGHGDGSFRPNGAITGNAVADMLLGRASSTVGGPINHSGLNNTYAFYLQDDWKVKRNLTLNLGVRYHIFPNWVVPESVRADDGRLLRHSGNFVQGQQTLLFENMPPGFVYPPSEGFPSGDPGIPTSLVNLDKNDIAPRIGLAWDFKGDGKTSLRAGYGVFFTPSYGQNVDGMTNGTPWSYRVNVDITPSFVNPIPEENLQFYPPSLAPDAPFDFLNPHSIEVFPVNYKNPYTQQFNLTLQQELGYQTMFQIAYVGNVAMKMPIRHQIPGVAVPRFIPGNDPVTGDPYSTFANTTARKPINEPFACVGLVCGAPTANLFNPDSTTPYGSLNLREGSNNSAYHSVQLQGRKRFTRGFSFITSYTFSKTMDFGSGGGGGRRSYVANYTQDHNDITSERALAGFHQTHRLTTSYNYNTPQLTGHDSTVVRHVLGDWQLTGIMSWGSGFPRTIRYTPTTSMQGGITRPNQVGEPVLGSDRSRGEKVAMWFNVDAFERPPIGEFGNVGRNNLIGPEKINIDFAVYKNITVTEETRLQVRVEFFNLPNRPNFKFPALWNAASSTFGQITATERVDRGGTARVIQIGAKFDF